MWFWPNYESTTNVNPQAQQTRGKHCHTLAAGLQQNCNLKFQPSCSCCNIKTASPLPPSFILLCVSVRAWCDAIFYKNGNPFPPMKMEQLVWGFSVLFCSGSGLFLWPGDLLLLTPSSASVSLSFFFHRQPSRHFGVMSDKLSSSTYCPVCFRTHNWKKSFQLSKIQLLFIRVCVRQAYFKFCN